MCATSVFTNYFNSNYVNDIHVEGRRVVWTSTGGVVAFDMIDSTYVAYDNTDGLIDNSVAGMAVDEDGSIFFVHPTEGLTQLTPEGSFAQLSIGDLGLLADTITCLLIDQGRMVIGTNAGFSLDGTFLDTENSGLVDPCVNVARLFGDTLWLGTNGGISKVHIDYVHSAPEWSSFTVQEGLPSNRVVDLCSLADSVWAATDLGVGRFDGAAWETVNSGLPSVMVRRIACHPTGVYAGTESGVAEWVVDRWEPRVAGLVVDDIRAMTFDANDTLWVGTYGGGIAKLAGVWNVYQSPGPKSNFINDVLVDRDGSVWCTHFEPWNPEPITPNALSRFENGEWVVYTRQDFGLMGNFRFAALDREGNRWFACFGYGLLKYAVTDSFIVYNDRNSGLRGNNTSFPLADRYNNRFFSVYVAGGLGEGISVLLADDSTWGFLSRDNYTKAIWAMALDSTGGLWLGSEMTPIVTRIDLSSSVLNPPDDAWSSYSSGAIPTYAISVDRHNQVWIGTSDGVKILEGITEVGSYATGNSPLLSNEVMDIEFDLHGSAVIATRDGLNILDVNGLWKSYRTRDGLPSGKLRAVTIDESTGEIWIGTDCGLSRFDSGIYPDSTLEERHVFPNPFVLSEHQYLVFRNTPSDATVRIYTLSGKLVKEVTGNLWDGRDQSDELVSSGVYIYSIDAGTGEQTGKFAVIK
jgi:hypothetical protein